MKLIFSEKVLKDYLYWQKTELTKNTASFTRSRMTLCSLPSFGTTTEVGEVQNELE